MRTWLAAAVALLALGACGAPPYPGTQPLGTVTGHLLAWPCAPVEIAGSPCPGRPVPNLEVDFTRDGGGAGGSAVSDSTGAYSVTLLAGTYSVSLKSGRPMKGPTKVTVTAGVVTTADFAFDSGIR
jgi:hypothetical protein